ncbi:alpha/beta hydrolase [Lewinella sp. IMCC34183]|uniref:alpha/beta hydrolase n=1 Tax=Lewinella sp. IMCC34183 TaxID=2248762 RepID=UPI000E23EB88|nr:alpha/beta hydrolase [Lewinella sp. IMCC34183]
MQKVILFLLLTGCLGSGMAQTNRVFNLFPAGTQLHADLPYQDDTLHKHLLDIYLPPEADGRLPLVIWIHGGAWMVNDKYADMSYMGETIREIINAGYALASIDYRFSTEAVFPAQLQDCNQAISWLYHHADDYGLDTARFALMGFSAGGHLASLVGLSSNAAVPEFFTGGSPQRFPLRAVVDFYGPAQLILFPGADDPSSPESLLLGASPLERPDLAEAASPVTYADAGDPPFLIIQGEKDESVDPKQSRLLSAWLSVRDVENELHIVPGAPHYCQMFDAPVVRARVLAFLGRHLK